MFTGDIEVGSEATALKINATYWTASEIDYSEIDTIEYGKDFDTGIRTSGFSSARLSLGIFQNEELGSYTLYAYTGAREFVVFTSGEKALAIGLSNAKETREIFDMLLSKIK